MAANIHDLKAGKLYKWCGFSNMIKFQQWQVRYCVVRPGIIYIGHDKHDPKKHTIPLNDSTSVEFQRELMTIVIVVRDSRTPIYLKTYRQEQYYEWCEALTKAIQSFKNITNTLERPIEDLTQYESLSDGSDSSDGGLLNHLADIYTVVDGMYSSSSDLSKRTVEVLKKISDLLNLPREISINEKKIYLRNLALHASQVNQYNNRMNQAVNKFRNQHKQLTLQKKYQCKCIKNLSHEIHTLTHKLRKLETGQFGGVQSGSSSDQETDEFFDAESDVSVDLFGESPAIPATHDEPVFVSQVINMQEEVPPRTIERRTALPKPRTDFKVSLWSILKDCIGRDLSKVALPVTFNEPTSFLQRAAEDFCYSDLLNKACTADAIPSLPNVSKSAIRTAHLVAFLTSPYASAVGRTFKPFNPLLGETYELKHRGFRYVSEQVTHHPPRMAYYVEDDDRKWSVEGDLTVNTSFTGKSLSIAMRGAYYLTLGGHTWIATRPLLTIDNVIFGKLTLDVFGQSVCFCPELKRYIIIEFLKPGWFGGSPRIVKGVIYGESGSPDAYIEGSWTGKLSVYSASEYTGPKLPAITKEILSQTNKMGIVTQVQWDAFHFNSDQPGYQLWETDERPPHSSLFYNFSSMTFELNELSPDYDVRYNAIIPPTDSRYRKDQRLLELGLAMESNDTKLILEDKQRAAAKLRKNGESDYKCSWFTKSGQLDKWSNELRFPYNHDYWEFKEIVKNTPNAYRGKCPAIYEEEYAAIVIGGS